VTRSGGVGWRVPRYLVGKEQLLVARLGSTD